MKQAYLATNNKHPAILPEETDDSKGSTLFIIGKFITKVEE